MKKAKVIILFLILLIGLVWWGFVLFGVELRYSLMILPLLLVTLTALLKNNESARFDKLELALEVLALLAMVYFTVFMLLPF
ncbi:unknown [Prevotella sp. CAG:1185]|uniref:hypothetical protein n=1 Tax=uncultured Prevotella sp. TaxID=159272 RepID=UPI00033DCD96|nr:hypothetical protein [uncultured Prevotella sp.]CCY84465.1 unknown [Prevotella sp. CAG:1185]